MDLAELKTQLKNNTVSGIYFGDIDAFTAYVEEKFGRDQLDAVMDGRDSHVEMSFVYYPKINSFRGVDELQFEIQYYQ